MRRCLLLAIGTSTQQMSRLPIQSKGLFSSGFSFHVEGVAIKIEGEYSFNGISLYKLKTRVMNKKWWIVIAVVVFVAVLMSLLLIPFELGVIREVYSYVVNEVVSVTGISKVLVKGIVIILLLPLLWVIPVAIKRKHKLNKFAWAGVLAYVAVFFLSISYFSQNINFRHDQKETLKWYALTPEGVKYFDTPGIDPVYGIVLKPLTPDIIGRLKLLEKGDIKLIDPENFNLFNSITGEPQAWYYCSESNVYEFYDKPGFHPQSGSPLSAHQKVMT